MTLSQAEAEKLARQLKHVDPYALSSLGPEIGSLCDHIISGSMKREIENAAYQRGLGDALNRICCADISCVSEAEDAIRSLIQPPAQKEGGK